jgi:hypothetical protein
VELLADTFDELCTELQDLLEALAQRFLVRNDQEHNAENGADTLSGERRYYKPPTA